MASTSGRRVVVPLTNKSGGGVIAGDVVIIDTANDDAFTTTTTPAFTGIVGIAQETIANNAAGRVLLAGEAALVNVSASVTRGHVAATHTVAKQAVSTGSSARVVGSFVQFKTGGTTPKGIVFNPDLGSGTGAMATDALWDAKGDSPWGTGPNTGAKLSAGSNGMVPTYDSAQSQGVKTAYPPGYEFDYAEFNANVSPTATTDATANTVVTGNAVTYDGSTIVMVEFFAPAARPRADAAGSLFLVLYDGAAAIGRLAAFNYPATGADTKPVKVARRLTPSAGAHTYSVRAFVDAGTGLVGAGAGGSGVQFPGFIRITKAA